MSLRTSDRCHWCGNPFPLLVRTRREAVIANQCSHWCGPFRGFPPVTIRTPRPPWLPLWGSCHEVTERVNSPSPPLRGTSPIGRGKTLVRLALAGDARASSLYTREPLGVPAPTRLPFSTIFLCGQIQFGGRCRRGQTMLRKGEAKPLKKTACFLRGLP